MLLSGSQNRNCVCKSQACSAGFACNAAKGSSDLPLSQPASHVPPPCMHCQDPRDGSSWQAGTSCWVPPGACSETGSGSMHLGARCAPLPPTGFFCLALPWQAAPDAPTDARCCPSRWKPAVPFHQHRPKSAASAPRGGALCPGDGWKGVSQPPNVSTSG